MMMQNMKYESLLTMKEAQASGVIKGKGNRPASLGYMQRLCRMGSNGTKLRAVKRNGEWLTTLEWMYQFNERILQDFNIPEELPRETTEAALRLLGVEA